MSLPDTLVSTMPDEYLRIRMPYVEAKNRTQSRQWLDKYRRAAKAFTAAVGDKPVRAITADDAAAYWRHWETRRDATQVTTGHATKHFTHMGNMFKAYHSDLGILPNAYTNPFRGLTMERTPAEAWTQKGRKLALPVKWITDVLYNPIKTDGLNEEAHGIAIICAEFGTRENEVYDLPPDAIVLDHLIPHLVLDVVLEGEFRREIKNIASKRKVPLLGRGLAVMRRYPKGFSRYRDTANYSNTINSYFRERKLFPVCKEDPDHRYTIGGLRHTFENRMRHARIDNEERAFLMGHSIEAIRGRPIYGSDLELPIRALLLEKIAFPTDDWTPRSHEELDAAIDRLLEEEGYRRR